MKKRLLSAFLALVMVLTLLPVSVFAAANPTIDDTGGPYTGPANGTVQYYAAKTITATAPAVGGWYWKDTANTYHKVTEGFVDASGKWSNGTIGGSLPSDPLTGSFKAIGSITVFLEKITGNLTIDTYGTNTVTISGSPSSKVTNLTIKNGLANADGTYSRNTVTVSSPLEFGTTTSGTNVSLTLENVTLTSNKNITVYHPGASSVTLKNAEAGDIDMEGTGTSASASTGGAVSLTDSKAGDITVKHVNATTRVGSNGTVSVTSTVNGTSRVGAIEMEQVSSTNPAVKLSGSGTSASSILVKQDTNSGTVVSLDSGAVVRDGNIKVNLDRSNSSTVVSLSGGSEAKQDIIVNVTTGGTANTRPGATNGSTTTTGTGTATISINSSNVGRNVSLTQDVGGYIAVTANSVHGSKIGGGITLTSDNSGYINLTNSDVAGNVILLGYASLVSNTNGQVTGDTFVLGTTDPDKKDTTTAPTVIMDGDFAYTNGISRYNGGADGAGNPDKQNTAYTIKLSNNAHTKSVGFDIANITVDSASISDTVTLYRGKLNVTSAARAATVGGTINLGSGNSTGVEMTVTGTNARIGAIKEASDNVGSITLNLAADGSNEYDSVVGAVNANGGSTALNRDNTKIVPNKITGGTWSTTPDNYLLNEHVLYDALRGGKHSLYMIDAIDNLVRDHENSLFDGGVIVKGSKDFGTGNPGKLHFTLNGSSTWDDTNKQVQDCLLEIEYDARTTFKLPSYMNKGPVTIWTGTYYGVPTGSVDTRGTGGQLTLQADGHYVFRGDKNTYTLNSIKNVTVNATGPNAAITAQWGDSGKSVIKLTGTYTTADVNVVEVPLVLDTDVDDVKVGVTVNFYPATSTSVAYADFSKLTDAPAGSMEITDQGRSITLHNGKKYTLDVSGLRLKPAELFLAGNGTGELNEGSLAETKVVVNDPRQTAAANAELSKIMSQKNAVDFSKSPAVLQAFGAITNTITDAQITTWRNTARLEAYKAAHNGQSPTGTDAQKEAALRDTGYTDVYAVLYMAVNVSSYGSGSSTTDSIVATLTPSWCVEVRYTGPDGPKDPIVLSNVGGSLGKIGDGVATIDPRDSATGIDMILPVRNTFMSSNTLYVHQDGNYVYDVTSFDVTTDSTDATTGVVTGIDKNWDTPGDVAPSCPRFTITHTASGTSTTGLGTFVISTVAPTVTLYTGKTAAGEGTGTVLGTYDNPQKALDEAKNTNHIVVNGNADLTLSMTGKARSVTVLMKGNGKLTAGTSGAVYGDAQNGNLYTVQLDKDNIVKPVEEPKEEDVTISVATVINGSATVSTSKAKAGTTVTVMTRPATGYGVSTLTIRTNTGATVAYQSTASNVYTFTVPQNVTSITVTPTFAVSSVATIAIAEVANGVAVHNLADGKARGGSTVTITTRPANGYTATGVTAVTNTGSTVTVTRIAENTYTFVVPIAATRVVVTPVFAAVSRHPFIDVPDGQWFTDAVGFCYRNNMMKGYGSDYMFSGWSKLTRAELVQILYRLSGEPYNTGNSGFNDVRSTDWYAKAVTWASSNHIVNGGDGNKFYPLTNITREQLAQILYNYNNYRGGSRGLTGNLSGYFDQSSVSGYAQSAMQWAVGNGIITGNNNMLMPQGTASRYEAATMLMRYGQNFMALT